jgi:hypothetical protein
MIAIRFYSTILTAVRQLLPVAGLLITSIASGQTATPVSALRPAGGRISIGILPFRDATASGNREVGPAVSLSMHDEVAHSTALEARILTLDPTVRAEEIDKVRAVEIGRRQKVDVVFVGTVLQAKVDEAQKSGWLPRIRGTAVSVSVRSVTADVALQGELYDVASGEQIASLRSTGKETDKKFAGTAWTSLGAWDAGSSQAFLNSPLGKALQSAIAEMVQKVVAAPLPVAAAQAARRKGS